MKSLDFARTIAFIMDREDQFGLRSYVEERRDKLEGSMDQTRPFRVLAHLIIDYVPPEDVDKYLPRGNVTVHEAARILMELADQTRITPGDKPAVENDSMRQLVRQSIFIFFLHRLASDQDDQAKKPAEVIAPEPPEEDIEVRYSRRGVFVSHAAHVRWSAIISDPERFRIIAEFLVVFRSMDYHEGYYRLMATLVDMEPPPDAETLRKLLTQMRKPTAFC